MHLLKLIVLCGAKLDVINFSCCTVVYGLLNPNLKLNAFLLYKCLQKWVKYLLVSYVSFLASTLQQDAIPTAESSSDVTRSQPMEHTSTPAPDDVIIVTSPVYAPMTREDIEAEAQTESTSADAITGATDGTRTTGQSHSTTTTTTTTTDNAVIEQSTNLEHPSKYLSLMD
jgi:hypothetical protein